MKLEGQLGQLGQLPLHHFWLMLQLGLGPQFFGIANPIRDLITIDYQDPNCCVWKFDCSKFVAIAPWHPTIDLAFARVSLSACALAALAACSTSHAPIPLHHPQHKTQHDPLTTNINPLWPAKIAPAPLSAPFLPAAALQGLPAVPPAFGLVALLEAPIVAWHH